MGKKPIADISVNTHITVDKKTVSINDALERNSLTKIIPDDEVYLLISRREFLKYIQVNYSEANRLFTLLRWASAARHRAVASTLRTIFYNSRVFTITGKQFKKVKHDEEVSKKAERLNRFRMGQSRNS